MTSNFTKFRKASAAAAFFALAMAAALQGAGKIGSPAPDLVLKDQFDKEFRVSASRGQVLVLVCGDREGSNYTGAWTEAVTKKFERSGSLPLRIVPIANLSGVPSFLQSFVKKRFVGPDPATQPRLPILLDWEGDLERLYGFAEGLANVYLIDRAGTLQFSGSGKGTEPETRALVDAVSRALATN
jgi:hypothetical protein